MAPASFKQDDSICYILTINENATLNKMRQGLTPRPFWQSLLNGRSGLSASLTALFGIFFLNKLEHFFLQLLVIEPHCAIKDDKRCAMNKGNATLHHHTPTSPFIRLLNKFYIPFTLSLPCTDTLIFPAQMKAGLIHE